MVKAKVLCLVLTLAALLAPPACCAAAAGRGWWRVDADAMAGLYSGNADRVGDLYAALNIEYEFPCLSFGTLALQAVPVFAYMSDADGTDDVNGGALGFVYRVYADRAGRTGWFAGLGSSVLLHDPEFAGNSSNVNFLSSLSLGYAWPRGWHLAAKASHISNAGLGDENAGINCLGLSFGRSF